MRTRAEQYRDKADEADVMADCFGSPEASRDLRVLAAIYRRMADDIERGALGCLPEATSYRAD
jgi:hypothetical protein